MGTPPSVSHLTPHLSLLPPLCYFLSKLVFLLSDKELLTGEDKQYLQLSQKSITYVYVYMSYIFVPSTPASYLLSYLILPIIHPTHTAWLLPLSSSCWHDLGFHRLGAEYFNCPSLDSLYCDAHS